MFSPSYFCRQGFIDAKIPESKLAVVPHGYSDSFINRTETIKLKTNKSYKFLLVAHQCHKRKQIRYALEMFGKAFNKSDDVCLVIKVGNKNPEFGFEESWSEIYKEYKDKYKNSAEIVVIHDYIDDISDLYRSCDAVISTSGCEGFGLTMLEALVSKKINICCDYGGQLDFCNKDNSLLIEGKVVRCPMDYQYWDASPYAVMYKPNIDHGIQLMKDCYNGKVQILDSEYNKVIDKYSWTSVYRQIKELIT